MMKKLISKIFYNLKKPFLKRKKIDKDISIISQNCIGSVFLHDHGIRFNSPTVNLFLKAEDFIKFLERINYYLTITPIEDETVFLKYPVLKLDDIKLYCVHYKSADEAILKWEERKNRINFNKLYVIMTDRDEFDKSLLDRFQKIPYKKILFSHIKYDYDFVVHVKRDIDINRSQVGDLTELTLFGKRKYNKYFNIAKWISRQ